MYVEKLILDPKHIEFQILADRQGHVVHLGERDCSIQRRNQKMMEESPCHVPDPGAAGADGPGGRAGRRKGRAATTVRAPVEFVLDKQGNFYFIEMNTRIQVEHPVTEMVTGIDLVKEQIRIAAGQELPLSPERGDPAQRATPSNAASTPKTAPQDFRPCPGTHCRIVHLPGGMGVRVDTAIYHGCAVSPYYDSAWLPRSSSTASTRLEAIRRMRRGAGGVHRGGRGYQCGAAISDPAPGGVCRRAPFTTDVCGKASG